MPKVEFLYDYASPWAYLASELLERRLAGAEIVYQPVYIRGFEAFSKGLPYGADKLRYVMHDLVRWSEHEKIPVRIPSVFPVNGLSALRGAHAARQLGAFASYHKAMFDAAWRDDRDISQKDVVIAVAGEVGLDRAAFTQAIDSQPIKDRLKADTGAAAARGVFGVPTFFVGDQMFWGQDRMDFVARALGLAAK
jgi:2-hydroxychromene-2-carboxylate isomerase